MIGSQTLIVRGDKRLHAIQGYSGAKLTHYVETPQTVAERGQTIRSLTLHDTLLITWR